MESDELRPIESRLDELDRRLEAIGFVVSAIAAAIAGLVVGVLVYGMWGQGAATVAGALTFVVAFAAISNKVDNAWIPPRE